MKRNINLENIITGKQENKDKYLSEFDVTPSGDLTSTDLQDALEEEQIDIDNLRTVVNNNEGSSLNQFTGDIITETNIKGALQDLENNNEDHNANTNNPHSSDKYDITLGNVENILNNYTSTTIPNETDDETTGYSAGSIWINTTLGSVFVCTDAGAGAAVWNSVGTQLNAYIDVEFGEDVPANHPITIKNNKAINIETTKDWGTPAATIQIDNRHDGFYVGNDTVLMINGLDANYPDGKNAIGIDVTGGTATFGAYTSLGIGVDYRISSILRHSSGAYIIVYCDPVTPYGVSDWRIKAITASGTTVTIGTDYQLWSAGGGANGAGYVHMEENTTTGNIVIHFQTSDTTDPVTRVRAVSISGTTLTFGTAVNVPKPIDSDVTSEQVNHARLAYIPSTDYFLLYGRYNTATGYQNSWAYTFTESSLTITFKETPSVWHDNTRYSGNFSFINFTGHKGGNVAVLYDDGYSETLSVDSNGIVRSKYNQRLDTKLRNITDFINWSNAGEDDYSYPQNHLSYNYNGSDEYVFFKKGRFVSVKMHDDLSVHFNIQSSLFQDQAAYSYDGEGFGTYVSTQDKWLMLTSEFQLGDPSASTASYWWGNEILSLDDFQGKKAVAVNPDTDAVAGEKKTIPLMGSVKTLTGLTGAAGDDTNIDGVTIGYFLTNNKVHLNFRKKVVIPEFPTGTQVTNVTFDDTINAGTLVYMNSGQTNVRKLLEGNMPTYDTVRQVDLFGAIPTATQTTKGHFAIWTSDDKILQVIRGSSINYSLIAVGSVSGSGLITWGTPKIYSGFTAMGVIESHTAGTFVMAGYKFATKSGYAETFSVSGTTITTGNSYLYVTGVAGSDKGGGDTLASLFLDKFGINFYYKNANGYPSFKKAGLTGLVLSLSSEYVVNSNTSCSAAMKATWTPTSGGVGRTVFTYTDGYFEPLDGTPTSTNTKPILAKLYESYTLAAGPVDICNDANYGSARIDPATNGRGSEMYMSGIYAFDNDKVKFCFTGCHRKFDSPNYYFNDVIVTAQMTISDTAITLDSNASEWPEIQVSNSMHSGLDSTTKHSVWPQQHLGGAYYDSVNDEWVGCLVGLQAGHKTLSMIKFGYSTVSGMDCSFPFLVDGSIVKPYAADDEKMSPLSDDYMDFVWSATWCEGISKWYGMWTSGSEYPSNTFFPDRSQYRTEEEIYVFWTPAYFRRQTGSYNNNLLALTTTTVTSGNTGTVQTIDTQEELTYFNHGFQIGEKVGIQQDGALVIYDPYKFLTEKSWDAKDIYYKSNGDSVTKGCEGPAMPMYLVTPVTKDILEITNPWTGTQQEIKGY